MHKILTISANLQTIPLHIQNLGKSSANLPVPRRGGVRYSTTNNRSMQMHFFSMLRGRRCFRLKNAGMQAEKTIPFISHFPVLPPLIRLQSGKTIQKTSLDVLFDSFKRKASSQLCLILNRPQDIDFLLKVFHYLPPEILPTQQAVSGDLRQTLILSPGEEIVMEASFQRRDVYDSWIRPPLLKDLRVSKKQTHQGFPFPSERVGWTLSPLCLPDLPNRSKDYPLFQGIREKQRLAKQTLSEKDPLHSWIEAHHLLRRQIFDLEAPKWLKRYQDLLETFIYSIDASKSPFFRHRSILTDFLSWVAKAPSPFEAVTHVHRRQLLLFLEAPYQAFLQLFPSVWATFPSNPHAKCEAARALLRKTVSQTEQTLDYGHPVGAYLGLVGPKIARGCENLLLQALSEKVGIAPPPLSLVERRLQICALQHLLSFLETLETRPLSLSVILKQMENEIEEDLHVLTGTKVHHLLAWGGAQELETYFLHRHQTAVLGLRNSQ